MSRANPHHAGFHSELQQNIATLPSDVARNQRYEEAMANIVVVCSIGCNQLAKDGISRRR